MLCESNVRFPRYARRTVILVFAVAIAYEQEYFLVRVQRIAEFVRTILAFCRLSVDMRVCYNDTITLIILEVISACIAK